MNPWLVFSLLVTLVLTTATWVQPRAVSWTGGKDSDHLLQVLLGDGRKILANQMFVQADVYFHSGYYPSVFDEKRAPKDASHMTEQDGHAEHPAADSNVKGEQHDAENRHGESASVEAAHEEEAHERAMAFLDQPKDWIEAFGRRFMITEHQHLAGGKEREMLPFLKLSAELDPNRVETYTVAAYWLSRTLKRPDEAEEFLRTGLKANPRSYEILYELGRIYDENRKDPVRAANLWEAALARWNEQEPAKEKPNLLALDQILVRLARLADERGDTEQAIRYLQMILDKDASPYPQGIQAQIDRIRARASGAK